MEFAVEPKKHFSFQRHLEFSIEHHGKAIPGGFGRGTRLVFAISTGCTFLDLGNV
jgi:hypothetical protein